MEQAGEGDTSCPGDGGQLAELEARVTKLETDSRLDRLQTLVGQLNTQLAAGSDKKLRQDIQ